MHPKRWFLVIYSLLQATSDKMMPLLGHFPSLPWFPVMWLAPIAS